MVPFKSLHASNRQGEEAEDVPREEGDDPGEGPSGVVPFDISPPGQHGDGGPIRVPAHRESEPRRPQGGADVPPARDTGGQLNALDEYDPPGPTNEPHLLGNRDKSISHIFQRINETAPWGSNTDDLTQYIHTYLETIRLEEIEDDRKREEEDYENGNIEIYVMTDPNTTLNTIHQNQSKEGTLNKGPPHKDAKSSGAMALIAAGITLIRLALAVVAPIGVIIGLKYVRLKDRVMEALIRIGMVITFFILIGILLICNGVSEHAPTLDPSRTPHRPKRAVRYKTAATPLWVRTQSHSWWGQLHS